MSEMNASVNGGIAQIRNVALCYQAIARTQGAHEYAPKLAVLSGRSGDGKTMAATYVAVKMSAFYVQAKSCWSRKDLMEKILHEMGIPARGTTTRMVDLAAEELGKSARPLIIDEFDHLVTASKVELVRDIYESSQRTMLLIGEEMLPRKLERWERFHGRVLNWVQASPANVDDARLLTALYAPRLSLDDELLAALVRAVKGSTRRIATNLTMLADVALSNGVKALSLADLKRLRVEFVTGESPRPRTF